MKDYYCINIEFTNVNFKPYYKIGNTDIEKIHHAHLYPDKDEIELKIFYEAQTYFGENLGMWAKDIDWDKFGSFLKVEIAKENSNDRLKKIDLTDAKLLGNSISTGYFEGNQRYTILKISAAKFYWNPINDKISTAEFYLDKLGFKIVEPFYSFLSLSSLVKNDAKFDIGRMKDSKTFYKLDKSTFRPEYNFVANDNRNETATIIKEPKIQFKYKSGVTESEAIFYGEIVLMLASFYHHTKIDFTLRRIHLAENTITIKNAQAKSYSERNGNLWGFKIYWNFDKFLQSSWQKDTIKNFTILSKVVILFNQSFLVDSYTSFIIRFNIIEICNNQKLGNEKFKTILKGMEIRAKQEEALIKMLDTIDPNEHEEFKKRWQDIQIILQNKPMKSQLVSFLEGQNLNPKVFPITIKDLRELRNNIIHGSIEKVNEEQLIKANDLLYRITGILILNLMGIKDWIFNPIID
jgi:hypothetical protein